jgi:F0F1-type ATP synthase epsilon subunit
VSQLKKGVVLVEYADGKCIDVDVEGGYTKVRDNVVIILATSASMFTEPDITPSIN